MNNNLNDDIWSHDVGCRTLKPKHRVIGSVWLYGWLFFPCSLCGAITNVELPTDGVVQSGVATLNKNGNTLNIDQSSQNLISTWSSFNIGQDATVNFNQPSHSAVAINYILDGSASQIMGRLNANGQVFLLNPNGIIFTQTGQVNVGGLVASTLELNPVDIETGQLTLIGDAASTAMIENQGKISSSKGGVIALIAPNINNTGSISTVDGMTHLTSASQVTLALQDGSLTQYQVDRGVLQGLIINGGAMIADNGAVYLTAKAKDDLSHVVINHTGVIEANRLTQNAQGEIILLADPQYGELNVSGRLIAEGKNTADGGWIETSAAQVNISDGVEISTLSEQGKIGTWLIDPYNVIINSTAQADENNSGFVATENDSVIDVALLQAALANNQVIVSTSAIAGSQAGNIEVNAEISWDAATALTLSADNNININADITATNSEGQLNLQYGQTAANSDANYYLNHGASINLQAGNNFTTLKGPDASNTITYQVITALGNAGSTTGTDLQGIGGDLSQNYALGADIDAQASKSWNSGSGFNPIGSSGMPFTGILNGLGHSISNLTVYRSSQYYVGLFAYISHATIENLSLIGGSVLGASYAGALVGYNAYGDIHHVDTSTSVTVNAASSNVYVGGVVGYNNNGSITDASSSGRVYASSTNANAYAGGLVGINYYGTTSQSYATGSVGASSTFGNTAAGGLVGYNNNGNISEAYATGAVAASGVSASPYVGGLVGYNNNGSIDNTYATGTAASSASTAKAYAGGLAGYNLTGSISHSYATGWVSAGSSTSTAYTGGLVPWSSGTVSDSFWDIQATGQDSSAGGGQAKTTIDMQDLSTFSDAGWQIDDEGGTANIWRIYDGSTQPLLRRFLTLLDLEYQDLTITYNGQIQSVNLVLPSGLDTSKLFMLPFIEGKNVGSYHYGYYSNQHGYDLLDGDVTLTIEPASLTITARDQSKTYGESIDFNGTEYIAEGLVNNEKIESVGLSSFGAAATASVNNSVPYRIEIGDLFGGAGFDANNYAITYIPGNLTILPAALTITAFDQSKTYGESIDFNGTEYSAEGLVNNEKIESASLSSLGAAATVSVNNSVPYRIEIGDLFGATFDVSFDVNNYAITYIPGNLTILPAALTITAFDQTKTYGESIGFNGTEYSAVGLVNNESIESVGLSSLGAAATASVNDGEPYRIEIGDLFGGAGFDANNYAITYIPGNLTVLPAALTLTAFDQSKTYGESIGFNGTEYSAEGLVNNEKIESVSLSSLGAAATASVNNSVPYRIEIGDLFGATFDVSFDVNNYAITYIPGNLTILPAALTITAFDQSKTYGESIDFNGTEYITEGLVNNEKIESVGLSSLGAAATASVNNSVPYRIEIGDLFGATFDVSFDVNNYAITYIDGDLTILPASLTITAFDQSKTYGESIDFNGTEYIAEGLVNNEKIESVGLSSLGAAATASVNDGEPYSIEVSNPLGATFDAVFDTRFDVNNYAVTYIPGNLTILPAALTITAFDQSKTYGESIDFNGTEYSAVGLVNNEKIESVSLSSLGAAATASVNNSVPYRIEIGDLLGDAGFDANNYAITYIPGNLTILPAALTITALDQSKTYGESIDFNGTEYIAEGLVNNEKIESVGLSSLGAAATVSVNDGEPYRIEIGDLFGGAGFDANNYAITYIDGDLTTLPAALTITAFDQSKTYGESIDFNGTEYIAEGLVNNEKIESVGLSSLGAAATASVNNSVPYRIEIGDLFGATFDANNYAITYIDGDLTILPASLTITASDQSKTYGESIDFNGMEYIAEGLVNNEKIESVSLSSLGAAATASVNNSVPYSIEVSNPLGVAFDAQNYQITYIPGSLTVNKKELSVTANSLDTVYNGQQQTLSGFTATGLVNGETEMVLNEVSASVTAKDVGLYPYIATGTDENYALSFIEGVLNIQPASILSITGITANDQLYDGLTTASLNTEAAEFNGIYSGDQLSVATAVGQFADANVGNDKTVYISELSLGGADAHNYNLVETTAVTQANIEAIPEQDTVAALSSTLTMAYLQATQFAGQNNNNIRMTTTEESDSDDAESSPEVVNTSGIQTLGAEN